MFIYIWTFCVFCFLHLCASTCGCQHFYDEDVIALIEKEGDDYSDDYLYTKRLAALMVNPHPGPKPEKIIQQAAYAFDSFRYNKCLEKIKEYERVAFPPPYDYPSPEEKLTILAYKAYSNKFLKKYESAIAYFEDMIEILKRDDCLAPECKFITYFEHAHCYLLNGNKKGYKSRIKKIVDLDIAPKYDYYKNNGFKIHHQPCFHQHDLNNFERFVFKEIAPIALGKELYAKLESQDEMPKIRTVADNHENKRFCRRMCARAGYISAIIVGCITKRVDATIAILALGELLIDCEDCCEEGWGSKNCCSEIKWAFKQACQQHMLDGL